MTQELTDYIAAGKTLGASERLEAAHQLLLSVDQDEVPQAAIDEEWAKAIDRRAAEVIQGRATLVDGREGLARIRAELTTRRG